MAPGVPAPDIERIAVLTSGGDAPGMNAAIRAAAKIGASRNVEVFGVERGYDGLIDGHIRPLDRFLTGGAGALPDVDVLGSLGGTVLGTTRCARFFDAEHRRRACGQLASAGVDALLVIGGNGTMAGAHALAADCEVPVVGVPASIDNDIGCTIDAIGVDTALNTIVDACDKISDTARSHHRAFVVEVMGRRSGYLAMASAVAAGADAVLLPETPREPEELVAAVEEAIRTGFKRGKRRLLIIKAEGVPMPCTLLVRRVQERLEDLPDAEVRATVLGHVVRGGRPSYHDRMLAGRLVFGAMEALFAGRSDVMVGWAPTLEGGEPTSDPRVKLFDLETVLAETEALLDGSSPITRRRIQRMEAIQGVLSV